MKTSRFVTFLLLAGAGAIAWYLWDKHEKEKAAATSIPSGSSSSSQGAPAAAPAVGTAPVTIASQTAPGASNQKFYPYGNGGFYFEDLDPSTYKTTELLNFTSRLNSQSAFKSI
jgi:hypothetical protein